MKSFVKYLGIIMSISRIGIIGAGQMGTGIAHVMALANYDVILNDVLPEHLISAKTTISQNLDRQISANKISGDEASKAMSLVKTSVDLEAVSNTDLIIEASIIRSVFETASRSTEVLTKLIALEASSPEILFAEICLSRF